MLPLYNLEVEIMFLEMLGLQGRAAVVTGAGRGLGKSMALALAEAGADLVLVDLRQNEIDSVAIQIRESGKRAIAITTDITKLTEVEEMSEQAIREFGKIDILVNNAGIHIDGNFLDFSESEWRALISVNVEAVFACTQVIGRHMVARRSGKIINITSMNAVRPRPKSAVYDSTKGTILTFTKALAREWAKYGVNVNAIGPGYFLTPLMQGLMDKEGVDEKALAKKAIPLGRLGRPEELGPLIVYLASSASDFMTGECIYIDGGTLIR
jgi:NAD(P)-dependent dehydrogenase (short-subunit alcohol dehydrogenase family)